MNTLELIRNFTQSKVIECSSQYIGIVNTLELIGNFTQSTVIE